MKKEIAGPNRKLFSSGKDHLKNCSKGICFLLILGLSLSLLYGLCPPDLQPGDPRGFLAEPKNSLDIMVMGNSDAYSGFSPMELWHAYGYTSFICGEAHQTLAESEQLLREVFSCQKPKIVILETDSIFTRTQRLWADAILLKFPFLLQEHNWKERRFSPIRSSNAGQQSFSPVAKGQYVSNKIRRYKGKKKYLYRTKKKRSISDLAQFYLNKMNQLCQDNGAHLLLLQIPSASSWTISKHDSVQAYADQHNLSFLDLDLIHKQFSFHWSKDSRDGGNHLNAAGAKKVTLYVGNWIAQQFSLSDKRSNSRYQTWNQDYQLYRKELK